MSVVLETPFATAEDTARELGVSKARLKQLLRLAGPITEAKSAKAYSIKASSGSGSSRKSLAKAKRRNPTRGKATRVAR
jgi:hypothetical protein